jgi:hypothetical protein
VVGIPYHGTKYDPNRFSIPKGDEDWLVVLVHCLASPSGGTLFEAEDVLKYADLANLDPDVWCFLPGTQLIDWNGRATPIEGVGDALALMGRCGSVSIEEVHPVRQFDGEVVTLDVEGVPGELIPGVTAEHPFWVAKGLKCCLPSRSTRRCHPDKAKGSYPCLTCLKFPPVNPEWCAAGEIEAGDYVAIPVPVCPDSSNHAPGLARLLGFYVAEGHVIENREKKPVAGVGWSFHADETRLHEDLKSLLSEHFGLETHTNDYRKYDDQSVQICAYGPKISDFCMTNGGRHAKGKQLSHWVWELSRESRLEFLLGWLDGDGHARNPARYSRVRAEVIGATVSPQLATQIYLLALSVGLRPYYFIRPAGEAQFPSGKVSPSLPCHCISFYGEDAVLLGSRMSVAIRGLSKTKTAGFFESGLYWARVRGVAKKPYHGPVFNLRTSTQEYVAGLLLTHNCFGHWHKDQGVQEIARNKWAVNIGSLSRGSLRQDEIQRIPSCAVLHFDRDRVQIEKVPLKVAPASEIFDLAGRTRLEAQEMTVDALVESLQNTLKPRHSGSLVEDIRALPDVPEPVKERSVGYVERAGGR